MESGSNDEDGSKVFTKQILWSPGLVSSVHPPDQLVGEAVKLGERIAQHSKLVVAICKDSVNNGKCILFSPGRLWGTCCQAALVNFLVWFMS